MVSVTVTVFFIKEKWLVNVLRFYFTTILRNDIATHEDYRGQGLASSIVRTFIDHCLENDIMPRWDCDILNKSSIKLAGKSGFGNPVQYSIFV
ncbi:GNAT family N-acetyltransferase [Peribacillus butanolivorans]|uniref:GNAT family N-acetyltransferase n=1 Tax=Peribacillus butanolivorans TaxID=421767 RepID=UPI0036864A88